MAGTWERYKPMSSKSFRNTIASARKLGAFVDTTVQISLTLFCFNDTNAEAGENPLPV